jgi:succinyl-diaminopimelate desuccinylase
MAENPIRALVPLLTALISPPLDQGDADFEPSNLEVTSVDVGNPAANVIPGEVRLAFNVRFNNLWTPESLHAEIARRVAVAGAGTDATLTFEPTNAVAFLTRPGRFTDLIAAAVEDVTWRRPELSTGGGTSDARFIKNACPVVELGLVNATIHAIDERVALVDLEALTLIYERAFERYFAEPPSS